MGAPRHGPPEMSFLRKRNGKVNAQKAPCLDAKMSQKSLRCKKRSKNQLKAKISSNNPRKIANQQRNACETKGVQRATRQKKSTARSRVFISRVLSVLFLLFSLICSVFIKFQCLSSSRKKSRRDIFDRSQILSKLLSWKNENSTGWKMNVYVAKFASDKAENGSPEGLRKRPLFLVFVGDRQLSIEAARGNPLSPPGLLRYTDPAPPSSSRPRTRSPSPIRYHIIYSIM